MLKNTGNLVAQKTWRGNWNETKYPRPKQSQESKLDEFIRMTYVDKKFYSDTPEVQPITKLIQKPEALKVIHQEDSEVGFQNDFDTNFETNNFEETNNNDFSTDFDQGFGDSELVKNDDFLFGTSGLLDNKKQNKLNLDDLFGSSDTQQQQQYQQPFQQQFQQPFQQQQSNPFQQQTFHTQQQYPYQQQYNQQHTQPQQQYTQYSNPFQQQQPFQHQQYQQQYQPQQQHLQQQYQHNIDVQQKQKTQQPQQKKEEKKENPFEENKNDPFSSLSWN